MDYGDSPEETAFRQRLRAWLTRNNPGLPSFPTPDQYWDGSASWPRALHQAGFFGLSWPTQYGGEGGTRVCDVTMDEDLGAAGAPPSPSLGYLVQGILRHGNEDIKRRYRPGIISGRDRWCQGFSEPEAGSDLASLRTRADRHGEDWVINGHKVWTSYSDSADWCMLLARTDPDASRHSGLSAFAVSMHQPGIQQRPLKMINGVTREFGEVLFEGATARSADMIGSAGEGWALAMTVVSHEREPAGLRLAAARTTALHQLLEGIPPGPP